MADPSFRLACETEHEGIVTSPAAFANKDAALTAAEKVNSIRILRGKPPYNRVCEFHGEKLVAVQPLGEEE